MSEGLELLSEVVRSAAAFHADQTRRQIRKEAVELRGFAAVAQIDPADNGRRAIEVPGVITYVAAQ
jgi:hypothetical protein